MNIKMNTTTTQHPCGILLSRFTPRCATRKLTASILGALALLAMDGNAAEGSQKPPMQSFIPKSKVAEFVVANLDLASFRNSFGPRREPGQHHFEDFGIKPTSTAELKAELDTKNWWYSIEVLGRRDFNGDGVEDLEIRFIDNGKGSASYRSSTRYVVTKYSENSRLVAIAYEPNPE
ncbi:MAG: hypothetical protein RL088_3121 [Verrucomicrobiota bacterium]|jgi:hypothetical protein